MCCLVRFLFSFGYVKQIHPRIDINAFLLYEMRKKSQKSSWSSFGNRPRKKNGKIAWKMFLFFLYIWFYLICSIICFGPSSLNFPCDLSVWLIVSIDDWVGMQILNNNNDKNGLLVHLKINRSKGGLYHLFVSSIFSEFICVVPFKNDLIYLNITSEVYLWNNRNSWLKSMQILFNLISILWWNRERAAFNCL